MASNDLLAKAKPQLNVKEFQDVYLRKNFEELIKYFKQQNQMLDFNFFEVTFAGAVANQKVAHGLGVMPQDIFITRVTGPGTVQFNWGNFDSTSLDISSTDACRVRFFAGSYWNFASQVSNNLDDVSQFLGKIAASSNSSSSSLPQASVLAGGFKVKTSDANNFLLVSASNGAGVIALPALKDAVGTGLYTLQKTDNSLNKLTIVSSNSELIGTGTASTTSLNTYLEKVVLIPTAQRWYVIDRTYWEGWTDAGWAGTGTYLSTNALANPINLNFSTNIEQAVSRWRRDGREIIQRFSFGNGTLGAATGTAGIISMPLITTPNDLTVTGSNGGNFGNNGVAASLVSNTFNGMVNCEIPNAAAYFRIMKPGTNAYYTLADIVANFALRGELKYTITGWEG